MKYSLRHKLLLSIWSFLVVISSTSFFLAEKIFSFFFGCIKVTPLLIISWISALISLFMPPLLREKLYKKAFLFLFSFALFSVTTFFLYKTLIPPQPLFEESFYEAIAIHEAGHAIVAETLSPGRITEVAIIEPRRAKWFRLFNIDVHGFCKYAPMLDTKPTLDTAKNETCILLSGAAAVNFFFPDFKFGGNRDDFSKAEELVQKTVNNGLSEAGPVTWNMLTEEQRSKIAQDIMKSEYKRAQKIISEHKDEVLAVSKELKEKGHLTGEELRNTLNSSPSK